MAEISVTVMAHPIREPFVKELIKGLLWSVVWDEKQDRIDTGLRSLQAYDSNASHHMVIQDDAIPCGDLMEALEDIVTLHPGLPLSLYVGGRDAVLQSFKMAKAHGASLLLGRFAMRGVASVWPTEMLPDLIQSYTASTHPNYDGRLTEWLNKVGQPVMYTVPSLVDHRPADESPSLISGRTGSRSAVLSLGPTDSAAERDWSKMLDFSAELKCKHHKYEWQRCPICGRWDGL